jgi:hypothetical protein
MAVISPPAPPRVRMPTAQTSRQYYTIHSNRNNAFTLKLDEDARTAIVGFVNIDDALCIGNMIETFFIEKKEWPDMRTAGDLSLPEGRLKELSYIFIKQWEFDDVKFDCTRNFLDFISVEQISKKKAKYSLGGSLYKFEAPLDFYKERIHELFVGM